MKAGRISSEIEYIAMFTYKFPITIFGDGNSKTFNLAPVWPFTHELKAATVRVDNFQMFDGTLLFIQSNIALGGACLYMISISRMLLHIMVVTVATAKAKSP